MLIDRSANNDSPATKEGYLKYSRRKTGFIIACTVLLVALSIVTIGLGSTGLSLSEIIHYIFHPDGSWSSTVVWDLRLKYVFTAIAAGAALGIAGAVMQSILRNPLASPFTLGLSNAAAFGASLAIIFMDAGVFVSNSSGYDINNTAAVTIMAFLFAMVATGVMLLMVKMTECTPETIVLAGMAISSIFSAGLAFLQYIASDVALSAIVYWQFGSLSKASWDNLAIIVIALLAISSYFLYKRWDLNAMESGEDVARGLGVNIRLTRFLVLTLSAVLTAMVVSFCGVIGFIGLVGPHIVKRLVGNDNRYVLVGSIVMGALVMLLSYVVGTYVIFPTIPVGIITSAIGGPLFIAILLKGRRRSTV